MAAEQSPTMSAGNVMRRPPAINTTPLATPALGSGRCGFWSAISPLYIWGDELLLQYFLCCHQYFGHAAQEAAAIPLHFYNWSGTLIVFQLPRSLSEPNRCT